MWDCFKIVCSFLFLHSYQILLRAHIMIALKNDPFVEKLSRDAYIII